ncbi:hypothetical protein PMIN03_007586 [Paraphaeosphaeria minitans]|uniref:Uncharacterized protein n=1 Tax=Paraphaeosphaeria minitans TaxID=565426 RepID=A0A9P6GQN4_9PLEO|nr:hypothetical protein PMIN01_02407 [Paraphaeosphaeria minitans]
MAPALNHRTFPLQVPAPQTLSSRDLSRGVRVKFRGQRVRPLARGVVVHVLQGKERDETEGESGKKGAQRKQKKGSWEEREVVMFAIGGCSCHWYQGGIRAYETAVGWVLGVSDGQGGVSKHEVQGGEGADGRRQTACGRTDVKRVGGRPCASPALGRRHWRPGCDERHFLLQTFDHAPGKGRAMFVPAGFSIAVNRGRLHSQRIAGPTVSTHRQYRCLSTAAPTVSTHIASPARVSYRAMDPGCT